MKNHNDPHITLATGKFGATEALHRGRYMIQFKVGEQEFSELTLDVD